MSLMAWIYLIEVARNIGTLMSVFYIICAGLAFFGFAMLPLILGETSQEQRKDWFLLIKPYIKWWVLGLLVLMLIPSKQTMYAMGAAKAGQELLSSPEAKEIGGKAFKLLNEKLDEMSSDQKEEKK